MACVSVPASNARPATTSTGSSSLSSPSASSRFAGSMPSSSHSDEPTSWPCARANGNIIAPPIRIVSATSRKASSTPILSVTLAPPTMATSGRVGIGQDAGQRLDLALEQPAGRAGQQLRHPVGRGVGAVGGAERVVHEHLAERRVPLRQLRVVVGLAVEEAHVLDHHHVAAGQRGRVGLVGQRHVQLQQLAEPRRHRRQRQLRVAPLRPAQVGQQHQSLGALLAQLAQGRQRGPDAGVVGDLAVAQRDVEVHPRYDGLAGHVEVVQRVQAD